MKHLIARFWEPRYPARYIGRHRAPSVMLMLTSTRQSRSESARVAEAAL